ncbi:MAG: hypothetical protein ACLVEX_12415 [Ruthenibacterium lactatiformans]
MWWAIWSCFRYLAALQGVPQREGYDAWLAELTKSHDTRFMLLQMPKDERLCYVREMRMTGEIAAVVVIEIDREELLRAFDAAGLPGDSATGVLLDGQLVAATGNMALLEDTPGLYAAQIARTALAQRRQLLRFSMPPPCPGWIM